ncbi:MAG TPA: ATP-binding protein [Herbaspirillum sp.]
MHSRWLPQLLLAVLHFGFLPAAAQATPLHITQAETFEIPGAGYSAPPYEVDERTLSAQWKPVELPHVLLRLLVPSEDYVSAAAAPTVATWYRVHLPDLKTGSQSNYLYIPRWKTDGMLAIYGDGKLLYRSNASIFWNGWNIPLWIPLNGTAGAVTPHTILLRIDRPLDSGGGISSMWVGSSETLSWRYRIRYLLQVQLPLSSSAAFLAVGLFSFCVWCRLRSERSYLLFFFIALASFLRTLHYYVGEGELPISDDWFSWLTINPLFWLVLATQFFLNYLHGRPLRWLNHSVVVITVATTVISLPALAGIVMNAYILAPLTYVLLILTGLIVSCIGYYQSRRVHSRDGMLLSAWGLAGMLLGIHDWLLQNNYMSIESIYILPYTNIVAFLIFMYIIYRRYIAANDSVKEVNANLKTRLQQREDELQESYERLRESEHRQTLSNERQRLMQDMHDGMGSSLLTALLVVEKGTLDANMLAEVLKDCIDDLKLTIDSMEPVEADLLLLLATLRFRLTPRLESSGIRLRWEVKNLPSFDWLDPRNSLHILRILQEAFSNIIKHAHATEICVTTVVEAEHVLVIVTDNGQGFSIENKVLRTGKGLRNQQRRAATIGSEIHINSSKNGTSVTLRLPISLGMQT